MKTKYQKINTLCMAGVLMIGMLMFAGCSKEAMPGAGEVFMRNMTFTPASITVTVNSTVKWTNQDAMVHNVTGDGAAFSSASINPGGTYSFQFRVPGTYNYRCTIHQGMTGVVIVQ